MEYVTAGESHGPYLSAIISGFPAQVPLDQQQLLSDLRERQQGYGRGGRMKIETDQVMITSGVRFGQTLGSPIGLLLPNRDFANWQQVMAIWPTATDDATTKSSPARRKRVVTRPRPGHADLVGGLKYGHRDLRNVLERASARETAMRVAVGSLCQQFLRQFGIEVLGFVSGIGGYQIPAAEVSPSLAATDLVTFQALKKIVAADPVRTVTAAASQKMQAAIDAARADQTTLGGLLHVVVQGLPAGLGSYVSASSKLDARLAAALMSINAIKGVSFGAGAALGQLAGRDTLDEIVRGRAGSLTRTHNHQGGVEGGMTNGQPLVINLVMKPIPTQPRGSATVDLATGQPATAATERSDVTAVPAAAVIAQSMTAIVLMQAFCEQFGSDNLPRIQRTYQAYLKEINDRLNE